MRKIISGLLALALCLPVVGQMTSIPLQAVTVDEVKDNTVTVDGLVYQLNFSDMEGISDYARLTGVTDKEIISVTIPSEVNGCRVEYVDFGVFSECPDLEQINTENTEKDALHSIDGVLFINEVLIAYPRGREGAYVIPDGTKAIEINAFSNASKLTSITLPDSLVKVGMMAFSDCTALEEVIGAVPDGEGSVFYHCSSLKSLAFAEPNPEYPDSYALDVKLIDCSSWETLIIPEKRMVSGLSLTGCTSLKSLKIATVSKGCAIKLAECDSLQSVTIPDISGVGSITVSECANLKQLYVGSSAFVTVEDCSELTYMNAGGFSNELNVSGCQKLERMSIKGSNRISVNNCPELTTMRVFDENGRFEMLQNVGSNGALLNVEVTDPTVTQNQENVYPALI